MTGPWTDQPEKTTIVDDDEFMILDSEDTTPSTINKRVKRNVINSNISSLEFADSSIQYQAATPDNFRFNLETLKFKNAFNYAFEFLDAEGLYVRPDGLKVFILDANDQIVFRFTLTKPWDVSTLNTSDQNLGFNFDGDTTGISFSIDGTSLFLLRTGSDVIEQFTLSTPWDLLTINPNSGTTATIDEDALTDVIDAATFTGGAGHAVNDQITVSGDTSGAFNAVFNVDTVSAGAIVTISIVNGGNGYSVENLSFLASSGTGSGGTGAVSSVTSPGSLGAWQDLAFSADGKNLVLIGDNTDFIYQFILTVPWDIETILFNDKSFSIGDARKGVEFSPDGHKLYLIGDTSPEQRYLTTSWDLDTAGDSTSFADVENGNALRISGDGSVIFILRDLNRDLEEHTLGLSLNEELITTNLTVKDTTTFRDSSTQNQAASPDGFRYNMNSVEFVDYFNYQSSGSDNVQGFDIKPDGSAWFVSDEITLDIRKFTMSIPWDILTSTPVASPLDISNEQAIPRGFFFKPDGLKLYLSGEDTDTINEYNLGTAWDLTTATLVTTAVNINQDDNTTVGKITEYDVGGGTDFAVDDLVGLTSAGGGIDGLVRVTAITTGGDIADTSLLNGGSGFTDTDTLILTPVSPSIGSGGGGTVDAIKPTTGNTSEWEDIMLHPSGKKLYLIGLNTSSIYEYTLETAWDISTISYNDISTTISDAPRSFTISPDGHKLYTIGIFDGEEYYLTTAWDITTKGSVLENSSLLEDGNGIRITGDGRYLFNLDSGVDELKKFAMGIETEGNILANTVNADTVDAGSLSFLDDTTQTGGAIKNAFKGFLDTLIFLNTETGPNTTPTGIFFKTDGKRAFVSDATGDGIYQADLSSAWDLTTQQGWTLEAITAFIEDLYISNDGLRLFTIDSSAKQVSFWPLSTAWDVTTKGTQVTFTVDTTLTAIRGLHFHPEGKFMYITDTGQAKAYQYTLPLAWDITSIVLDPTEFTFTDTVLEPSSIRFLEDGKSFYATGEASGTVERFTCTTPWDITTAVDEEAFSVITESPSPVGLFLEPNLSRIFVTSNSNDDLHTYNFGIKTEGAITMGQLNLPGLVYLGKRIDITTATAITLSDETAFIYSFTGTSGSTIKIPNTWASNTGRMFIIKDEGGNAGVNNVTITTTTVTANIFDNHQTAQTIASNGGTIKYYVQGSKFFSW